MAFPHETQYGRTAWEPMASVRSSIEPEGDAKASHDTMVVIIGDGMKRGDPDPAEILRFRSSSKMKKIIGTGTVMDLAKLAWFCSTAPDMIGANWISVIRVGTPTQSVLSLTDGATAVLTATHREYGKESPRIKVEDATTVSGGKKITVSKVDDDGREIVRAYDNLINAFVIRYQGSGIGCTMTITLTVDSATRLTTSVTGVTGDTLDIDLTSTNYDTIGKVINYINSQASYEATIDPYADPRMESEYLDEVTAQDIMTANYTLTAVLGSIISRLNLDDPVIGLERVTGETTAPENIPYTYLAGGVDNTAGAAVTTQDYVDALDKLTRYSIDRGIIIIQSTSAAVHAAASAWEKQRREGDEGRWKVFCGHPSTETYLQVAARAQKLNSIDVVLASPGIKLYDTSDVLQSYDSVYYAALLAGQAAGSGLTNPLTNKSVPIDGLITKHDKDEREYLIQSGVTVAKYDDSQKQFVTTLAMTTYSQSNERFYRILYPAMLIDFVEWSLKEQVERRFKGKPIRKDSASSIAALVMSLLDGFVQNGILVYDPADTNSKPYSTPSIEITSGAVNISFSAWYSDELDFMNISQKANLATLKFSVALSA